MGTKRKTNLAKKLVPTEKVCEYCKATYRSIRPHCGAPSCLSAHHIRVVRLWHEKNSIAPSRFEVCKTCLCGLDAESVRGNFKHCSACRMLNREYRRRTNAHAAERREAQIRAEKAAVLIATAQAEKDAERKAEMKRRVALQMPESQEALVIPAGPIPIEEA